MAQKVRPQHLRHREHPLRVADRLEDLFAQPRRRLRRASSEFTLNEVPHGQYTPDEHTRAAAEAAFRVLHSKYGSTKWAKRTPHWYDGKN
jgi:hypothetical protein